MKPLLVSLAAGFAVGYWVDGLTGAACGAAIVGGLWIIVYEWMYGNRP